MYIYFSADGSLKEIITEKVFRQGDSARDKIYIYVDGIETPSYGWVSFRLPNGQRTTESQFFENGNPQKAMVGKALPTQPLRNLKYFSYDHTYIEDGVEHIGYKFFEIEVPDDVLSSSLEEDHPSIPTQNNLAIACVRFVFADETIFKIGDIPFSVETSAGILTDIDINYSQYNYLLKILTGGITPTGDYVPYTGADKNVALGNNKLSAKEVITEKVSSPDEKHLRLHGDKSTYIDGEYIYLQTSESVRLDTDSLSQMRIVSFPDKDGTIAMTSDIVSVQNAVPYSGAVGNVDLGQHTFTAKAVYIWGEPYGEQDTPPYMDLYVSPNWQGFIFGKHLDGDETLAQLKVTNRDEVIAYESDLPSKNVAGTFNTSSFAVPSGKDYYQLSNIVLSGELGDLLIITWGNSFAICPVPSATNIKGEQLVDGSYEEEYIQEGVNVYGTYSLLGRWTLDQLYPTAGADIYLHGNSTYHVRLTNGEIEILEYVNIYGQLHTKVQIHWTLSAQAQTLCPGWDGTFDLEDEEVWELDTVREGYVAASMIGSNGQTKITKMKYVITDLDTKLQITTDSSFTPPTNYTGYVINYKIV